MTRKLTILDTDFGTDVDDMLALSLVLTSPDVAPDVDVERAERFIGGRLAN